MDTEKIPINSRRTYIRVLIDTTARVFLFFCFFFFPLSICSRASCKEEGKKFGIECLNKRSIFFFCPEDGTIGGNEFVYFGKTAQNTLTNIHILHIHTSWKKCLPIYFFFFLQITIFVVVGVSVHHPCFYNIWNMNRAIIDNDIQ